jgi:hypothetical protein
MNNKIYRISFHENGQKSADVYAHLSGRVLYVLHYGNIEKASIEFDENTDFEWLDKTLSDDPNVNLFSIY